jgi:hypothetical protein
LQDHTGAYYRCNRKTTLLVIILVPIIFAL